MVKKILLLVLLLALVAGGWFWSQRASWLAEFNAQRAEEAAAYAAAGAAFGGENDQQACLDKALHDFDTRCSGFSCTVKHGRFLDACLEQAAVTPGFCEGVPPYEEKPGEEARSWAREACWARDIRGEGCRLLLRQQQYFCSGQGATAEAAPAGQ